MATFQSFEEIEAWQRSRQLTQKVRKICKLPHVKKDFSWVDQITRSSRSISANIAEGFESLTNQGFISYLGIAKCSCGETRSHLYDGLDEGYLSAEEFSEMKQETLEISRMVAGLIHYLQTLDPKKGRTFAKLITNN